MLVKNKIFAILYSLFSSTALLFLNGSLMQSFLLYLNVSERLIGVLTTVLQAVSLSVILLFSRIADRGNIILRAAFCYFPHALLFLCYIPLCLRSPSPTLSFAVALGLGVLQTFFVALHTVCQYKLPYFIYRPKDFGIVASVGGIVGSLLSLGIGALLSALSLRFDFARIMLFGFIAAAALMLLAGLCTLGLRTLPDEITAAGLSAPTAGKKKVPLIKIFCTPVFSHLIIPNLLRGFATGITLIFALLASGFGHGLAVSTALTAVQSAAILIGCLFYGVFTRFANPRILILAGSLVFLLFPLLAVPLPFVFLTVVGIILFGRTLVDYAIPDALLTVVPTDIAGPYHAWRMILLYTGQMISTAVGLLLPIPLLFALVILAQLVCGLTYFFSPAMRIAPTPQKATGDLQNN